jgi:hypothetical protein
MGRIEDKIRKLHALAKGSYGHEAATAEEMVRRLLEKHGLTLPDVVEDEPVWDFHPFKDVEEQKILFQIMIRALGVSTLTYSTEKPRNVGVEATVFQHIQIREEASAYLEEYRKQRKALTQAFIVTNRLHGPREEDPEEKPSSSSLSVDELERIRNLMVMMKPTVVRRSLEEGRRAHAD